MSKIKIKFKLQGLELEIEGTKDDVPLIMDGIGQQISGLLQPAATIVGEPDLDQVSKGVIPASLAPLKPEGKKRPNKKKSNNTSNTSSNGASGAIDFINKPEQYGTPRQIWKTSQKAMWILYVVSKETSFTSMTAPQISDTFNKHFRQAGEVRGSNISRDLGKLKVTRGSLPPVSEDTTQSPSQWFLTEEGEKLIVNQIQEQLSENK